MSRSVLTLLVTALLGAAVCAPAFAAGPPTPTTHYRWKDASGVVHFSDTIPASALASGYDIVNDQGRIVRHVDRELTPAERRAAMSAAAKASAARREAQQRHMSDQQLLTAYATDKDLELSQQAQLRQIQVDITALESNLHSQEETLTELLAHAADLQHSNQPIPPYVHRRIADQRETVSDERGALARRNADLTNAKVKFAEQLKHYRELQANLRNNDASTEP